MRPCRLYDSIHAVKAFASAMDGVNVDFAGAKIDRTPRAPLSNAEI